jgi:hypothetical protein
MSSTAAVAAAMPRQTRAAFKAAHAPFTASESSSDEGTFAPAGDEDNEARLLSVILQSQLTSAL